MSLLKVFHQNICIIFLVTYHDELSKEINTNQYFITADDFLYKLSSTENIPSYFKEKISYTVHCLVYRIYNASSQKSHFKINIYRKCHTYIHMRSFGADFF